MSSDDIWVPQVPGQGGLMMFRHDEPMSRFALQAGTLAAPPPPDCEDEPLLSRIAVPPRSALADRSLSVLRSRHRRRTSVEGFNCFRLGGMRRDSHAPALSFSLRDLGNSRLLPRSSEEDGLVPVIRGSLRSSTERVKDKMMELAGSKGGRVQVNRLEQQGFTTEDLSRVIYDKFRDTDLPDFLDYVDLEKKGGLERIGEIWYDEKYFWFAFLVASVVFNTSYLLAMDWAIFQVVAEDVFQRFEFTNVTDAYSRLVEKNAQTADLFKSRTLDPRTRPYLLHMAAFVAIWEICWIIVKVSHSLYIWCLFAFGASEYRSFHAVMYFFHKLLPQFGTFSAIKLMAKVHPSLIYNEYLHVLNESSLRSSQYGRILILVYFILKCLTCGLAATGAFTIKLLAVSVKLTNPSYMLINRAGSVLALLMQCMGCVIIEIVLQDRLFLFVFGGQDAMYEDIEHAYKNVYEARVARQIWKDFWHQGLRLKALVLLATFDHYDLQRLLIVRLEEGSDLELGTGLNTIQECEGEAGTDSTEDLFSDIFHSRTQLRSDTSLSSRRESCPEEPSSRRELVATAALTEAAVARQARLQSEGSERGPDVKKVMPRETTSDSQSSVSSALGMQTVTRYLKDHMAWRDVV